MDDYDPEIKARVGARRPVGRPAPVLPAEVPAPVGVGGVTGAVPAPVILAELVPDSGSDVDPPIYTLVCQGEDEDGTRCVAVSVELNGLAEVQGWACVHMMRHPDRRSFRMIADVPMVAVPETEPE
ncbi:hypothetical protein KCH_11860 [Kitasatospora cheerisanensis KCTC 2395]|uniref:DUF7848 domain-containing protein n=2 Tax=Kitasatospora cheerisanensis TaxID=81942 RepID=A0A066Z9W8_9ACTN|nr:hypothetical protein KCH_11860 [Kitasatospora cheerisanensis KCTC 2395]